MLDKIHIRKDYLLGISVLLLLIISYELAFKKTMEAWQINKKLKSELVQAADLGVQPAYIERKNNNLSKILGLYKADTVAFRNNTINTISAIAEKEHVKLSNVPLQDPLFDNEKFTLHKLSFSGGYFALTKVFARIEKTPGIGRIRSATYKILNPQQTGGSDRTLSLDLFFEIVK